MLQLQECFDEFNLLIFETRISCIDIMPDDLVKDPCSSDMLHFAESEKRVDDQGEVNRLLKKAKDEISIENREKEAGGESSEEAMLKELGIQSPEGKIGPCRKSVMKLVKFPF